MSIAAMALGERGAAAVEQWLRSDAPLAALLRAGANGIAFGWPSDAPKEADFPRITLSLDSDVVDVPGTLHTLRLRVVSWVWQNARDHGPGAKHSARVRLGLLEGAILARLDGVVWSANGVRCDAVSMGPGQTRDGGPGSTLRRQRDFQIKVGVT